MEIESKILLFDMMIDGKNMGTFPASEEDKHKKLRGLKGVEFNKFWGTSAQVTRYKPSQAKPSQELSAIEARR